MRQKGFTHSKDTKLKMAKAKKGKTWNRGKKRSAEVIIKMKQVSVNEKSYRWMGDNVGYRGIHVWVKRNKGKPSDFPCLHCGQLKNRIHWANVDHLYKRNLEDYLPLCAKCHREYDIKNGLRPDTSNNLNRKGYIKKHDNS